MIMSRNLVPLYRVILGSLGLVLIQGCATHAPEPQTGDRLLSQEWDTSVGGHDRALSGQDGVLSRGDSRTLGGRDNSLGGGDTAYSDGDQVLNPGQDQIFGRTDRILNRTNSVERPQAAPTPKRTLTKEEMAALTVAVSKLSGDPNALSIVEAQADDTSATVRNLCARLHDSRLDDDNNRYNVVFGILESSRGGRPGVSVIDSGQRASVVCQSLGYLS